MKIILPFCIVVVLLGCKKNEVEPNQENELPTGVIEEMTDPSEEDQVPISILADINLSLEQIDTFYLNSASIIDIPVKFHIARTNHGAGGLAISEIDDGLTYLNDKFSGSKLNFVHAS